MKSCRNWVLSKFDAASLQEDPHAYENYINDMCTFGQNYKTLIVLFPGSSVTQLQEVAPFEVNACSWIDLSGTFDQKSFITVKVGCFLVFYSLLVIKIPLLKGQFIHTILGNKHLGGNCMKYRCAGEGEGRHISKEWSFIGIWWPRNVNRSSRATCILISHSDTIALARNDHHPFASNYRLACKVVKLNFTWERPWSLHQLSILPRSHFLVDNYFWNQKKIIKEKNVIIFFYTFTWCLLFLTSIFDKHFWSISNIDIEAFLILSCSSLLPKSLTSPTTSHFSTWSHFHFHTNTFTQTLSLSHTHFLTNIFTFTQTLSLSTFLHSLLHTFPLTLNHF